MKYEVIESRVWQNNSGQKVSIYGALPYHSEAQKNAERWRVVVQGWTVLNPYTNEVGIGRAPWPTREAAQQFADMHKPASRSMYD